MLEVNNLTKVFHEKNIPAVNSVSFCIRYGECLGLIGQSGSGKSTVANILTGFITPDDGEIMFRDTRLYPLTTCKHMKQPKGIQMIFQTPVSSFSPRMSVLDAIAEGLRHQRKLARKARIHRAHEMMELVGLNASYANRFCGEISGGECQRAAIARALISNPNLLICDEATSSLDVSIQAVIIELLAQLKKELALSYLFITHDIALASNICDNIAVMKNGKILELGTAHQIVTQPAHPYTKQLVHAADETTL